MTHLKSNLSRYWTSLLLSRARMQLGEVCTSLRTHWISKSWRRTRSKERSSRQRSATSATTAATWQATLPTIRATKTSIMSSRYLLTPKTWKSLPSSRKVSATTPPTWQRLQLPQITKRQAIKPKESTWVFRARRMCRRKLSSTSWLKMRLLSSLPMNLQNKSYALLATGIRRRFKAWLTTWWRS